LKGIGESFPLMWLNVAFVSRQITQIRTAHVLFSHPKHVPKTGVPKTGVPKTGVPYDFTVMHFFVLINFTRRWKISAFDLRVVKQRNDPL